jgi:tetratricopeptide (TPR) repeat protein
MNRPRHDNPVPAPGRLGWSALLPLALAAVVYLPSLGAGFVWDDPTVIFEQVAALRGLGDLARAPTEIFMWSREYFRPMHLLSAAVDRELFGARAAGHHAMNILFHVLATGSLLLLARRLLAAEEHGRTGALVAATLFAVHPILSESVVWISARTDVLATMFLLPAISLSLRFRDHGSWLAAAGAVTSFCLALLSKEVALAGAVLLPAALWLAPREAIPGEPPAAARRNRSLVIIVLVFASIGAYFWLRAAVGMGRTMVPAPGTVSETLGLLARTFGFYVLKPWLPWPQTAYVTPEMLPGTLLTTGIWTAAMAILVTAVWLQLRRSHGLLLLAVLWFSAAIAPALAAAYLKLAAGAAAERYLYLPTVAVVLACGAGAALLARRSRRGTLLLAAALTTMLASATLIRSRVWHSDLTLWTDAAQKAPLDGLPLGELGVAYARSGDLERAAELWMQAQNLRNDAENAGIVAANLGNYWLRRKDLSRAGEQFESALQLYPDMYRARQGLARVLLHRAEQAMTAGTPGDSAEALLATAAEQLAVAIRINASDPQPLVDLFVVRIRQGDLAAAAGDARAPARYREALLQFERLQARDATLAGSPALQSLAAHARDALALSPAP